MVCAKANVLVKIHETVKSKILHLLATYMCSCMQDTNTIEIIQESILAIYAHQN